MKSVNSLSVVFGGVVSSMKKDESLDERKRSRSQMAELTGTACLSSLACVPTTPAYLRYLILGKVPSTLGTPTTLTAF